MEDKELEALFSAAKAYAEGRLPHLKLAQFTSDEMEYIASLLESAFLNGSNYAVMNKLAK